MEDKNKEKKPEEQLTQPESAFPASLLEFQIETKEDEIDRVLLSLKQVGKKNKEYHKRNDLLKKEQQAHLRRLLEQIEEEKEKNQKEVVTRDDVEESLKATWQYVKDKEQLLEDLNSQMEQRFKEKQAERDYWLEYKNVGSKVEAEKILNLTKDIEEVKDDFHRASEYYRKALKALEEENDRLFERQRKLSMEQAIENAVRYLDEHSLREIQENEWLKEEVKMYQKEVSDLKASVQLLEEENINLVTKLIDSRLQNLRAPSHLFLSQAAGLQDEFPKDEMKETEHREDAAKTDGDENLRSAIVPCQEKKAFPKTQSKTENEKPQDSGEELWEKSFTPTLGSLLYEDEKDFQEYSKLGPLETTFMCVIGRAVPIHKEPKEMPSRSHSEDGVGQSDRDITAQMIKALTKEKFG